MPVFQTKPRTVQAFLFNEQKPTDASVPAWYADAILAQTIRVMPKNSVVETPQGPMRVMVGQWLVHDDQNVIMPMNKDVFERTFERIGPDKPVTLAQPPIPPDRPQPAAPNAPAPTTPAPDEKQGLDWPIPGKATADPSATGSG